MNKEDTYIIGVSGGPDSMALLDYLHQQGCSLIVAHVNYKQRPSAQRDAQIVYNYCQKEQIPYFYKEAPLFIKGNFQAWARQQRYDFFKELTKLHKAKGVYIAHHQDDHLETYLLQKERNSLPLYWGLKEENEIDGLIVYRPFLNKNKQEIIAYCQKHNITYGVDETNRSSSYKRNHLRKEVIEKLSTSQREELLAEIKHNNIILSAYYGNILNSYQRIFKPFKLALYQEEEKNIREEMLRKFFLDSGIDSKHFSKKHLGQIDDLLIKGDNVEFALQDEYFFYLSYQEIGVYQKTNYSYYLNQGELLETPYFMISHSGDKKDALIVSEDEYPLHIRNWQPGDKIRLSYGTKRISRWFIDHKISYKERSFWPIVLNNQGEIIFAPEIGRNITHYSNNSSLFMIKCIIL